MAAWPTKEEYLTDHNTTPKIKGKQEQRDKWIPEFSV